MRKVYRTLSSARWDHSVWVGDLPEGVNSRKGGALRDRVWTIFI